MMPSKIGDVCYWMANSKDKRYYLVTKIGPKGGCFGPCIYPKHHATKIRLGKLRSTTWLVPDDMVPDDVSVAIAVRALTGEI